MTVGYIVLLVLNIGLCLSSSEGINDELLERIKALEDRETLNAARIYHLENQVKINNEKYENLHQQNIILKNDLTVRTNKLDQLERIITHLIHDFPGINKGAENEQTVADGLKETVIQMQKSEKMFANAIQSDDNELVEHVEASQNGIEIDNHLDRQHEASNIQANNNITNDASQSSHEIEMLKLLDATLDTQNSGLIKKPDIARQNRQQNYILAFYAVLSQPESQNLSVNEIFKFNHVHLNEGNGYHNQHGLFIAPRSGLYLFSSSLTSDRNSELWGDLIKNGQIVASLIAGGDTHINQGSVTAVAQLKAGDSVWVRHTHGGIWGNYYSSFCGVLLIPE